MKRKIVLFSWAVAVCTLIFFIGYSRASLATGLFRSAEREMSNKAPDYTANDRARTYGRQFASWLNGNVPGGMVPSAAVGVIQGDELVFHHGVRADLDTRFGIASLSKTFTAVLALRLHEKELLDLDAPVSKYLPGVVIGRAELHSVPVTVRHLLAHTSGIPSYGSSHRVFSFGNRSVSVPAQVHPAGYCYSYSNEGYALMMLVIEAATGKSYAQNMQDQVLGPLGMTASTAEFANGTGGIVTTIRDLAKFTAMLLNRGRYRGKLILGEESFAQMLAKPVELPATRVDYYYSLSWEVITVGGEIDSYYKAGRWFNQASGLQAFPSKKIAFIYLCNPPEHLGDSFMSWRQGLTGMLRYLVRKISDDERLCTEWPSLTPGELKWYEGSYRNVITGETVKVSLKSGTLFSNGFGGFMPLRTFTSNRFLIDSGRMLHNFVWKDNRVVGLALRHGYYELVRP
ncbi:MAG TPA: serine hydrolase domain-containing protein [Spirochaetota bacterium]|nr:serine hydrolase domain-containing protein [Spirochaetota bacterium]